MAVPKVPGCLVGARRESSLWPSGFLAGAGSRRLTLRAFSLHICKRLSRDVLQCQVRHRHFRAEEHDAQLIWRGLLSWAIFCHVLRCSASKTAPLATRLVTLVQLMRPFARLATTTARLRQEVFARTLVGCRPITLFLLLFILERFHCRSSSTASRLPCCGSA